MQTDTNQVTKCKHCQSDFEITEKDKSFYNEMKVPLPGWCGPCRQLRRLVWRNERVLYPRKCDSSGQDILSVFSTDKPFPVYKSDAWYSDSWDPLKYGRDFDFNRPFFEQFQELMHQVPQLALSTVNNYNCDYVNQCGWCKNCYLIFEADGDEDSMYCAYLYDSKTCVDCSYATKCQLCYESVDVMNCYNLKYSQNCTNCSDSWFLKNCIGCTNCFGCVNLRNKQYYFLNQKCTKEEYEQKLTALELDTVRGLNKLRADFVNFAKKFPHKYMHGNKNENSSGDYIYQTKDCEECYDTNNAWDCKYVFNSRNTKKVYDMTVFGAKEGAEFCVDNHEIGGGVRNIYFSDQIWTGCYNVYYSKLCVQNTHDVFGCVGLRHKEYCILNKKYSQEEYESLKSRVIEHMKGTGEWGEFFPMEMSPYGYNETLAQFFYPSTKEEVLQKGLKWKDSDPKEYKPASCEIPLKIADVRESITNEVLACSICKKNYRITVQELGFYKKHNLPIPLKCHDCRHFDRMTLRNPRKLFDSKCAKCSAGIKTTFAPERPEPVYCENCYLASTE